MVGKAQQILSCEHPFIFRVATVRQQRLSATLWNACTASDLDAVNTQLHRFVDPMALHQMACHGLRGEVCFAVPLLLQAAPPVVEYYRHFCGLSHRAVYGEMPKEAIPEINRVAARRLGPLCQKLCRAAQRIVSRLDDLSLSTIHELQRRSLMREHHLLSQSEIDDLRADNLHELLKRLLSPFMHERTRTSLRIENAAGRPVFIEFASDPDVLFTEKQGSTTRLVLSIEVKGGADASNIHNRLGEAEKSHLKAKRRGCTDLWTLTKVDVSREVAERASPTTTRFFNLTRILDRSTADFRDFREALCLRLGVPVP